MTAEDVETMHGLVDNHHQTLEEELQDLFGKIRARLIKEHNRQFQPIVKKLERQAAEQDQQNDTEKRRGEDLETRLGKIDIVISRFLEHLAYYRDKEKQSNQKSRVFKAWADMASGRSIMRRISYQLYLAEPMKRILFKRWVRRMRKVRIQRQKRELRRAGERGLRQQESEAQQKITALQSELEAVQQLLLDHEKQHGEMQQKLRRAFMRGVVNLNLEAMDVFGEVPTAEAVAKPVISQRQKGSDDEDDFVIEPAPRISVVRHH